MKAKHYVPRSDCSLWSSLIWVYSVCNISYLSRCDSSVTVNGLFILILLYMLLFYSLTRLGLSGICLRQSVAELWPFPHIRNSFNFVSTQYFESNSMNLLIICIYALITWITTRSELGSLCLALRTFSKELRPLTCVRISFALNILRMNGWDLKKTTSICIDIDEILVGIVMRKISQIYN